MGPWIAFPPTHSAHLLLEASNLTSISYLCSWLTCLIWLMEQIRAGVGCGSQKHLDFSWEESGASESEVYRAEH